MTEPVVCIDEHPLVLHDEVRTPIAATPGKISKRDSEYKREGTAKAFCVVEQTTLRLDKVDQVLRLFGHTVGPVPVKREAE